MDSTVRDSLERCLPETEPPMRLQLQDVIKRGRRRRRIRTLAPAGAAVVVALMIGSVFATVGPPPPPSELPPAPPTRIGTSSVPTTGPSTTPTSGVPAPPTGQQPVGTPSGTPTQPAAPGAPGTSGSSAPGTSTSPAAPPPPSLAFRAPSGHILDDGAQILTDRMVKNSLPAERIVAQFGTRSENKSVGDQYIFGGHLLWQEGTTYGYMYWLHRKVGDFPVTGYGLPVDPCVDPTHPAPGERCQIRPLPNGEKEVLFDIDRGYRLRGVVQYWAPDLAVTYGFYLPQPGGDWPQFPGLSGQGPLASIPYTAEQLSQLLTLNRL